MELVMLNELIMVFAISVAIFFVFIKFRIPSIVGLLLTGVLVGPYGLGIVKAVNEVETLAEIGVVLLLFTIGMEFSFDNLLKIRRSIFLGGTLQVVLTILVSYCISRLFGFPANKSIFVGFLISLSSTAIVLRIIQDRAEIDSTHARTTLGILIFQDLIVVPMMLFTPLLAGIGQTGNNDFLVLLVKGALIIVFTFIGSKWVIPAILFEIAKTRSRELFLLTIIVICFSVAWFTYSMGLSLALGAFLAGLIISESEYNHDALGNVLPFRDLFTSVFFVSIGMLLNINIFAQKVLPIIGLTIGLIILKLIVGALATIIMGFQLRTSVMVGAKLAQIGEFSFVLAKIGVVVCLLSENELQVFIAVSILTMSITPYIINNSSKIAELILKLPLPQIIKTGLVKEHHYKKVHYSSHVIVIGFGLNGRNLTRTLSTSNIPYVILETNPQIVKKEKVKTQPIIHGDATHEVVLNLVGIREANAVVIAISDASATRKIIRAIRKINPEVYVIVRTKYVDEMSGLYKLGADEVIPEEFETSIEIFTKVLEKYEVPKEGIDKCIEEVRMDRYHLLTKINGNN